jgi:hypothetical protein
MQTRRKIDGAVLCHAKRSSPKRFASMVARLRQGGATDAEIVMESKVIIDALGSRSRRTPHAGAGFSEEWRAAGNRIMAIGKRTTGQGLGPAIIKFDARHGVFFVQDRVYRDGRWVS